MIENGTRQRIQDKIDWCYDTFQRKTGRELKRPNWRLRQMGRCAGKAFTLSDQMEFNPDYMNNGHMEHMINQTVPHEVAHMISVAYYGHIRGKGHKDCWKHVMRLLEVPADRCHDMSLEGVKTRNVRRVNYKCDCCGTIMPVTLTMHNKIVNGSKRTHTKCGRIRGTISYVGAV